MPCGSWSGPVSGKRFKIAPSHRGPFSSAEEVGFEPTVGFHLHRFSKPALSATQAPLRGVFGDTRFTPSPILEELGEDRRALACEHAPAYLGSMVEPTIIHQAIEASARSRLGIARAIDDGREPRQNDRAGAHRARLQRHEHGAAVEPPVANRSASQGESDSLGMRGGVVEGFSQIKSLRKNAAVSDDHGPDRHFAQAHGLVGESQGQPHRGIVHRLAASTPERIRTSNLRFRRPMLYPVELRVREASEA